MAVIRNEIVETAEVQPAGIGDPKLKQVGRAQR
jgi:hypothetical protein